MRKLALILLVVAALRSWAQDSVPQPDKDGVYSLGGEVKAPKLVHTAPAQFPTDPRLNGMRYRCIVSLVIDADGKPGDMRIEEAQTGPFGTAAIEAVEKSEFKPGSLHGDPVPVRIEVWVPFVQGEKHAVPEEMPVKLNSSSPNDKNNRPPVVLQTTELQYSDEAKRIKFEGTGLIHAVINEQGLAEDIRVVQPVGHGLDMKAIEAVSGYRFAPGLKWGIPVRSPIYVQVQFRLH